MATKDKNLPRIARYKPYYFRPIEGKRYFWCSCGRSEKQPFCDGSHKGTGFAPYEYTATGEQEEVLFCGCKKTSAQPFCDGTHNGLLETYPEDDPRSPANLHIATVSDDVDGRLSLNGRCYVIRPDRMTLNRRGNIQWRALITAHSGARHQSHFYFEIDRGETPVTSFGARHIIALAVEGSGDIEISGRRFALAPEMGVYVRPGETFAVRNANDKPIKLHLTVCPQADEPEFDLPMNAVFDASQPRRTVEFDPELRRQMGNRTFQLLVDKDMGSDLVTQFIGDIPLSKAQPHRHLYEETLVLLTGHGQMWTEDLKVAVRPGDVIFLPSKQLHSLECTDPNGIAVAGVIYPGGNPDINF